MNVPAPSPSLGFSVGISGHRADRISDPMRVRQQVDRVLSGIQSALDTISAGGLYAAGAHPVRMVSALAEGADRIAAHAALDHGHTLEVVLPFDPAEYEKDFPDGPALEEFRQLLARATAVITLDGAERERPRAYEAAGLTMLDNCDILIAIWDGQPGRGRGGTREVIEQAAHRAQPIIVIPPDGSSVMLHGGIGVAPMRFEDLPVCELDCLPDVVASLVGAFGYDGRDEEWRKLAEMPGNPIVHGAYPLMLKLFGLAPWFKRKRPAAEPNEVPTRECALKQTFEWWDTAAIRAAQAFRSAVIVNFFLAAFAVVLAATSLLFGHFKWLFVLVEILTIILLLANTMSATRRQWQERWLESRQVAELLRVCMILRSVGIGRGIADPGEGGSNGWYAGAIARSCPMQPADLSAPARASDTLIAEIRDQADWNHSTSRRMHKASHRIEKFGEVLFVIVLAAAIGWLGLYFFQEEMATKLKYLLTAITAGLPALATASYGIRIILDFEGIAGRAHRISAGLNEVLEWWGNSTKSAAALQETARRATDIMLSDVAAWRLLAEGRRLTIPG